MQKTLRTYFQRVSTGGKSQEKRPAGVHLTSLHSLPAATLLIAANQTNYHPSIPIVSVQLVTSISGNHATLDATRL
ncbi:MAG: hypothetical protein JWM16_3251 [Verrucomicrobiales bacterium]|nr:hypothetical protein [Verrucomicrobiales bacterium]